MDTIYSFDYSTESWIDVASQPSSSSLSSAAIDDNRFSLQNNFKEDDDVLTAKPVFTPQPNAFTHPTQGGTMTHAHSAEDYTSYFQSQRVHPSRPFALSYPQHRNRSHTPYNIISPSHQAEHDAALRASLSTLLSYAAAARGLPKRESQTQQTARSSNRIEPSTLRTVPQSVALGKEVLFTRFTR